MGVAQFIRKASLLVGEAEGNALDLSQLKFSFSVRRGDRQTPNSAEIRVYNVAPSTAKAVEEEFTRVVLQAGYEGNYGVIFDGEIKQVRRGRISGMDTYLDITAADGDSAYNFSVTAISLAAELTTPEGQAQQIIKSMVSLGVDAGYVPDSMKGNPLPRGKAIYGMTRDELRKLAKNTSTSWSIQDGKINFVPETAYMPGDVPVINAATGMVGLPEQTQGGIRVKVLLNPSIKIGQAIQLDNASIQRYRYSLATNQQAQNLTTEATNSLQSDGFYYVMIADHTGDTRGNDWYTDLTCLSIDATLTDQGFVNDRVFVSPVLGSVKRYG